MANSARRNRKSRSKFYPKFCLTFRPRTRRAQSTALPVRMSPIDRGWSQQSTQRPCRRSGRKSLRAGMEILGETADLESKLSESTGSSGVTMGCAGHLLHALRSDGCIAEPTFASALGRATPSRRMELFGARGWRRTANRRWRTMSVTTTSTSTDPFLLVYFLQHHRPTGGEEKGSPFPYGEV